MPEGANAYLLKSAIHDRDDAETIAILRKCRAAMGGVGRLLVVEPIIRPGNDPNPAKFIDLNILFMLGRRFERLYAEAGFGLTGVFPTRSRFSVIEGAPV